MHFQDQILRSIRRAREMVARPRPMAGRAAAGIGLRRGQRDYTRFIVLGRSRTGSNYLRSLLNSHPGVKVLGEVFRNQASLEWGLDGYPGPQRVLAEYQADPVGFMEHYVFRSLPRQIQAFGFKIFYYHAQSEPWNRIWTRLRDDPDLRVLHMKRRNILRTHLSRARAARSDRWVQLSQEDVAEAPIRLDPEECRRDFEKTRLWETEFDRFFAGHAILQIEYEALSEDYRAQAARAQEFLGVTMRELVPQTFKQSTEPLSTAISNYEELKRRFQGTAWASFFEE